MFIDYQKLKPVTPGTRNKVVIKKNKLSKQNRFVKGLIFNVHRAVGRSATTGHITVWGRGSGAKKLYRSLNLSNTDMIGVILFSTLDPNRNAFISLAFDLVSFRFFFSLSSFNVGSGAIVACALKFVELKLGYTSSIKTIPAGTVIHNLQLENRSLAQYSRSAGTFCQVVQKTPNSSTVRLPSGSLIRVSVDSYAKIGVVSNKVQKLVILGKAGVNRHLGFRPKVRGVAMNPVDHPHGGRTNGGRPSVTPWGMPAHGKPTSRGRLLNRTSGRFSTH